VVMTKIEVLGHQPFFVIMQRESTQGSACRFLQTIYATAIELDAGLNAVSGGLGYFPPRGVFSRVKKGARVAVKVKLVAGG